MRAVLKPTMGFVPLGVESAITVAANSCSDIVSISAEMDLNRYIHAEPDLFDSQDIPR